MTEVLPGSKQRITFYSIAVSDPPHSNASEKESITTEYLYGRRWIGNAG